MRIKFKFIGSTLEAVLDKLPTARILEVGSISKDDNYFYISVPNYFHKSIIEGRYLKLIENALRSVTDKDYIVKISVVESSMD